ncbi:uncharacterized protein LOC134220024 isoform X2 [Armigeres subalbatus]|uniref:uncharacterized protein LOC134220024 isoform X2 n=1 Tax=Armigeres subalbatus TaxID=124917 RepID=UPI002ED4EDC9
MTQSRLIVCWVFVVGLIIEHNNYGKVSAFLPLLGMKPFGRSRGPLGGPRPFARRGMPFLRASNPFADSDDKKVEQKTDEVVHSSNHVEDIIIPELLSTVIGYFNADGTIEKFATVEKIPEKSRRKRSIDSPSGYLIDSLENTDNDNVKLYDPHAEVYPLKYVRAVQVPRSIREASRVSHRLRLGAPANRYATFIPHEKSVDSSNDRSLRRILRDYAWSQYVPRPRDEDDLVAAETIPQDVQDIRNQISQASPPDGTLNFLAALNEFLAENTAPQTGPNQVSSIHVVSDNGTVAPEPVETQNKTDKAAPGTVINYNFFQFGCCRDNNLKDGANPACIELLSQIPHRIDKRKGVHEFELVMDGTAMENPIFADDYPTRKLLKPIRNKRSGRKLKVWKLHQILDSDELLVSESQHKPDMANVPSEVNEDSARPRDPRHSRDSGRYRPNRGDQSPMRIPNPLEALVPVKRTQLQAPEDQAVDSKGRRIRPKLTPRIKGRRADELPATTTTTEQPKTTTSTAAPTTTPQETTTRKRFRLRPRQKKSIENEAYYRSDSVDASSEAHHPKLQTSFGKQFKRGKTAKKLSKKPLNTAQQMQLIDTRNSEDKWEKIFALTTPRTMPRRSINNPIAKSSKRDSRWRLKRAQQFRQRRFKNGHPSEDQLGRQPINIFTSPTPRPRPASRVERFGRINPISAEPSLPVSYNVPIEYIPPAPPAPPPAPQPSPALPSVADERRQRKMRPVSRQPSRPRLGSSSAEIMKMGPPREPIVQPIVQPQTGIPPAMQDFIVRKVKEHCETCNPNEVIKNPQSRSASPARYYSSYKNKSPQSVRAPRTQPVAPPSGLLGMNPRSAIHIPDGNL